jgi:hypothetical protein
MAEFDNLVHSVCPVPTELATYALDREAHKRAAHRPKSWETTRTEIGLVTAFLLASIELGAQVPMTRSAASDQPSVVSLVLSSLRQRGIKTIGEKHAGALLGRWGKIVAPTLGVLMAKYWG